jgi:FkbM family methyltransferase
MLRRLTYFPQLTNLARRVGLAPAIRSLYHRWAAPGGVLKIQVSGVRFGLYAKIPEELRFLEGSTISKGVVWCERGMLEAFLAFLRLGDIVYDVGANFGLYSIALGKRVGEQGQIIAFEPLSRNFERLQANIQLNDLKNIRFFPKALGEQGAKVEMYIDEERPWRSTLLPKPASDSANSRAIEVVEVVEGDSFRIMHGLPVPCAVKIDVEGFEGSVLRGFRQTLADPRCRLLGCAVHPELLPSGMTDERIVALLRSLGFRRIDAHTQGPEHHLVCYKE